MRKKLCLAMCVLTFAMLTACGSSEVETTAEPLYNYTEDVAFTIEQNMYADGVEIIYQITSISNYLYMPLNEEGMYIRIKVSPADTENFNIQDYLEITRNCYYIIHETE